MSTMAAALALAPAPDGTDTVPTNGTSTGASTAATTLHDSAATSSQQSRVFALHTFTAENDDELSFQHGEFLTVLERDEQFGDGWWKGRNARGEEGLFPASYILPEGTDPSPYLSMQQAPDLEGLKAGAAAAGGGGSAAGTDAPGTTAEQQEQQRSPSPARSRRASQEDLKQHEPQPQQQLASVGAAPETAPAAFVGTSTGPIDHTVQQVQQAIDHHHHESSSTAADGAMDGRDTRSRLAEQARLENERTKSRAASGAGDAVNGSSAAGADGGAPGRISGLRLSGGVPAGLVYSDESDSGDDRDDDDEEDEEMPMTSRLGRGGSGAKAVLFGVPPASATSQEEPVSAAASSSRALAAVSQEPAEKAQQTMAVPVVAEAAAPAAVEPSAGSTAGSLAAPAELAAPVAATLSSAASNRAAASGDVSPKGSPRGLASATTRSVHSTNGGGGGGGSDVFGTPPLSDPATGGPFRDASPFDGHQPPVTSVGAGLANGLPPRENTVATTPSSSADGDLPAGDPATWSIHQVVQWASAKGFEPAICEKFAEHEITGDVLLDLDANLLKELEIPQFGKRIKIANAIAELKAPQAATPAATAAPAPVATRQSSFRSGMGMAAAEPIPEDAEARHTTPPVTAPSSTPQTPALDSAAVMSAARSPVTPSTAVNGGADQTRASPANGPEQQFAPGSGAASLAYAEWARAPKRAGDEESKVHQQITPEPPLAPAPESSSATAAPTSATLTSQHTRSASGSIKSRRSSVAGAIPPSPSTPNTKRSSQDRGHKKGKPSIDSNKTQGDRISFFGGGLGRNRKPAPRYPSSASTMNLNDDVGDRSSTSPTSPRAPERAISLSRLMGNSSNSNNNKEASRLSKQSAPPTSAATAPSSPAPGAVAAAAASGSAIDKIGKPDFAGYMKKKGDRYNSWKTRYFVLKGANLYYLRDENEQKVKGHIDLRGYKVLSDPNTSAGNYGFQIAHDQNKTHFFSSNEHRVIKEWMKQLMKATITRDYSAPVVSSCNIPTIPLREAQMMAPRPPSPTQRAAAQRANRRDNPNALTPRDASVLMSLDGGSPTSPRRALPGGNIQPTRVPSRPSRDMRRPSEGRQGSVASIYPDESPMVPTDAPPVPAIPANHLNAGHAIAPSDDAALISWVNAHLPPTCVERATDISTSFRTGKLVTRVIEHLQGGKLSSERSPDNVFELQAGEPNIEGLFAMFDKCIDENVDHGGASPNDIRTGNAEQTRKLLENLRQWGDAR